MPIYHNCTPNWLHWILLVKHTSFSESCNFLLASSVYFDLEVCSVSLSFSAIPSPNNILLGSIVLIWQRNHWAECLCLSIKCWPPRQVNMKYIVITSESFPRFAIIWKLLQRFCLSLLSNQTLLQRFLKFQTEEMAKINISSRVKDRYAISMWCEVNEEAPVKQTLPPQQIK